MDLKTLAEKIYHLDNIKHSYIMLKDWEKFNSVCEEVEPLVDEIMALLKRKGATVKYIKVELCRFLNPGVHSIWLNLYSYFTVESRRAGASGE